MTDEEYVFRQTERERKRDGRGTFSKKRQGGKTIRFPSDMLTKKERNAMNGEVDTYNFKNPLKWKQFQAMPTDIQQAYLDMLTERYRGISNALIGESMGVKNNVFAPYLLRHKLKVNRDPSLSMKRDTFLRSNAGLAWAAWLAQAEDSCKEMSMEEVKHDDPVIADEVVHKEIDVKNIAVLLQMLAGSGAKLTIELNL